MTGPSGRRVFATVDVPAERLALGPTGYRVKVVDFDAEAGVLYKAHAYQEDAEGRLEDIFCSPASTSWEQAPQKSGRSVASQSGVSRAERLCVGDANAGAFLVRAGRRVHWGFDGHQLHVAPHAFVDANAFCSHVKTAR